MKKSFLVIVGLLVMTTAPVVRAQDTIWQRVAPLKNYFSNNWVDTSIVYGTGHGLTVAQAEICAQQFVTDDTLQVYGIAAMMVDYCFPHSRFPFVVPGDTHLHTIQDVLNYEFPEDPTLDHLEEWLLLFQYHGPDSTATMDQLGDSMYVSYHQTPTYYMMSYRQPQGSYLDTVPKPVYERYFQQPQTVYDTFYTGFTQNCHRYNRTTGYWYVYRPPFRAVNCVDHPDNTHTLNESAYLMRDTPESSPHWRIFHEIYHTVAYFLFPILTPDSNAFGGDTVIVNPNDTTGVNPGDTTIVNPGDTIVLGNDTIAMGDTLIVSDTTIIGGDTIVNYDTILAIVQTDLLQRLTSVIPNPAAETAKVVSSPGMSRVEVFSMAGRRMYDKAVAGEGLSVKIDVSRWPTGTYIVRIHTPLGVSTKKLAVSR